MSGYNLEIEPYHFCELLECSIKKCVNQHFEAIISGYINETEEENFMKQALNTPVHINGYTETGEKCSLFKGFVFNLSMEYEGGLRKVTLNAKSNTGKLDCEEKIRTFQGKNQTYKKIIEALISDMPGVQVIYSDRFHKPTEGLIVQYQETDWDFIKRMAREAGTVIVPDCTNDFICFYCGVPHKKERVFFGDSEYRISRYSDLNGQEQEEIRVDAREDALLCEPVVFQEKQYFIYRMAVNLERNELIYHYDLRAGNGFEREGIGNKKIAGASIFGEVEQVKEDQVRVRFHSHKDYDFGSRLWFPYATVYSSPDGAGWYCMPERGDQVRLHFPDANERNAYVISAVHVQDKKGLRKNPDEKSFRTKYDKEIRLTPGQILITNHEGLSIILDDEEGIQIKSNKEITMISEHAFNIQSGGNVQISANDGVYLRENQNLLMVRNGIKEQAMRIEHD